MTLPARPRAEPPPCPALYRSPLVLGTIIGQLGAFCLHRRCHCPQGFASCTPIWRFVERYGGAVLLGDLLPRLVCQHCRRPPEVILAEDAYYGVTGGPTPGWSVVLPKVPKPAKAA